MDEPLGIIAGNGRLPVLTAAGMRAAGHEVVGVGLAGQFIEETPGACDRFAEVGVFRPGEWARRLRGFGARRAAMVGGVTKHQLMYDSWVGRMRKTRPDWRAMRLWYRVLRRDQRSQTVLGAIAGDLAEAGIELIDTTRYIPDHLAEAGVMTRCQPTRAQRADITLGWSILLRMNDLEIGQALAVRDRDVVAVEAIEGTDAMIRRAGQLVRGGGWTLLKGGGPKKDLRFDVPTLGVKTIEGLKSAGASCVAVEAGRVILMDRPRVIEAADAAGIAVVGIA